MKMKNLKVLSAISAVIMVMSCSLSIVSANEVTELPTEAITEISTAATSELTTEISIETTTPITAVPEETTVTKKRVVLYEFGKIPEWTDGEYKKSLVLPASSNSLKNGDFLGLYTRGGKLIDSEYYTVEYDGEKNITFTFGEKFRNKYKNGSYCFNMEFENASIQNMFGVIIADPENQIQTSSPKTSDTNTAVLTTLLGLSGMIACIFKKRENG